MSGSDNVYEGEAVNPKYLSLVSSRQDGQGRRRHRAPGRHWGAPAAAAAGVDAVCGWEVVCAMAPPLAPGRAAHTRLCAPGGLRLLQVERWLGYGKLYNPAAAKAEAIEGKTESNGSPKS